MRRIFRLIRENCEMIKFDDVLLKLLLQAINSALFHGRKDTSDMALI